MATLNPGDDVMFDLSLIAAVAENGVIGNAGTMPWHFPADLAWFRQCTQDHTVIMGANTFRSIGKPLPNRDNRVVSSILTPADTGCAVYPSLKAALTGCVGEVFVIGGAQLYQAALPHADKLYLTHIHRPYPGDTFFPPVDLSQWQQVFFRSLPSDPTLDFVIYDRIVKKEERF